MVLYPLTAALIVVMAQYAHTRSEVAARPDKAAEIWRSYRNFLYLWATIFMLAAFGGVFFMNLPVVP